MRTHQERNGQDRDWESSSTAEMPDNELYELPSLWIRIAAPCMRDEAMYIPLSPGEAFVVGSGEGADVHVSDRTVSAIMTALHISVTSVRLRRSRCRCA